MNRRAFLSKLGILTVGGILLPHVPKTLYFDMGRRTKPSVTELDQLANKIIMRSHERWIEFVVYFREPVAIGSDVSIHFDDWNVRCEVISKGPTPMLD